MADETENQQFGNSFKVEFYAPDETPTLFSDAQFVIHTGNEFIISFYQAQYPAMSDEIKPQTTTIKSRCIVRIAISPAQMHKLVEALQSNIEKVEKKKSKQTGE